MYQHLEPLQQYLKDRKAAAALLRLPENLVLFAQVWPRYGFTFLFVPAVGDPTLITPVVEVPDAELQGLKNVIPVSDVKLEDGDPVETVIGILKKLAKQHGIAANQTIAIEGNENRMAPTFVSNKVQLAGETTRRMAREGFQTDSFVHVRDEVYKIRQVKNDRDIAALRRVNKLANQALDYFEEILNEPGIREIDVLTRTESRFCQIATGYEGALAARAYGQLTTGPKSLDAFADGVYSDTRVLEKGDVALFEFSAVVDGYWADLTRSACVGGYTGKKKELFDLVVESFNAGVRASKDGATGHDVDKASRDVIEAAGYGKYFVHANGHAVGFAHYEGYPVLCPDSTDVLRTNMVIAVEPGVYLPDIGGIRLEKSVLVGRDGGTVLE